LIAVNLSSVLSVKQAIFDLFSGWLNNIIADLVESLIMRRNTLPLLLLLLLTLAITACGNKGPLTLPEEDKKAQKDS
jgi:DMSO/TMAO reductase YedYZ heme-binding membrane subunit